MYVALFIFLFLIVASAAYAGIRGAPWVPTRARELSHLLTVVPDLSHKKVMDLGCGTGSVLFALAKRYPSAQYFGIDLSLGPLLFAWARKLLTVKRSRAIHFTLGDIVRADITQADVLFLFLMPKAYEQCTQTVLRNAKPDALIIFQGWEPAGYPAHRILTHPSCLPLYLYQGDAFHI